EVVPYFDALGSAPALLTRTISDAVAHQTGSPAGAPSVAGQLAHMIFPLTSGEQGVLDARGIPAVLVQASGERGPAPAAAISGERLEGLGRSVLNGVDALDAAPDISPAMPSSIVLARKTV